MTAHQPLLPATWQEVLAAPAFVINLDRTPERLGPVMERLAAAGFSDIRRVRGVDGLVPAELEAAWAALGNPVFREDCLDGNRLAGRPGLQGAFSSHALLWRRIVDDDIPFCTIFEDDVAFHPDWHALAASYHADTPAATEAVWLGSWSFGADVSGVMVARMPVLGLFAILITREGARRLLELTIGDPRGIYAFDPMIHDAQLEMLAGGPPTLDWVAWTRPTRDDPAFPPFHPWDYPAHGLVRSIQSDSTAQLQETPARLVKTLAASAARGDLAAGRLAADRLRSLHTADPAAIERARRDQLAFVGALGAAAGQTQATVQPAPAPEAHAQPAAGLPALWGEVLAAPAFVINLDRTPERLGPVLGRLAAAGFTDVRRVRGVDGQVPAELAAAWAALGNPVFRDDCLEVNLLAGRTGLQGAFASHGLLWRHIVEEDIPFCTIFEDDAAFHPDWDALAAGYYAATPRDAEAVWLGAWSHGAEVSGTMVARMPALGLFAILVTREGARRLLDLTVGDPRGIYAFDPMIRDAHLDMLAGGPPTLDWVTWTRPARDDPAFPPFHLWEYPAHGLVRSIQTDSTAQLHKTPTRLVRTIEDSAARGDLAAGLLAADRLRCLHDANPADQERARRDQLAFVLPLGGAGGAVAAAASPAVPAPAPAAAQADAGLPATWQEVLAAPAFFINLDRMPERRGLTERRLAAAGFSDVRRVRGVDGLGPDERETAWAALGNPPFREDNHPDALLAGKPGLQGVFLSHALLWRRIVEEDIPFCTIFEDDSAFHPDWDALAPAYYAVTRRDLNAVWLGSWALGAEMQGVMALPMPVVGLHATSLTRDGARRLLEMTIGDPEGVFAIDCMIRNAQFAALTGEGEPFRWATWTRPAREDPSLPPFEPIHHPAHGLVASTQDDSGTQMNKAPRRLVRTIATATDEGEPARGLLAADRLRCLHEADPADQERARRDQLAFVLPLGGAGGAVAAADSPAVPAPAPAAAQADAGLPATWQEVLAAPAFFINLDRMPERRRLMERRLAAAGFTDVRRVRGVDGQVPAELALAWSALGDPPFREGVTPPTDQLAGRSGLQGAFTSHALLWRRIVDEQIPVCTVFEDDAQFDPRWAELAPRFHAVTPRDAEVVWMGAFEPGMTLRGIRAESFPIIGLYACIVTLEGARRLLEATVGDPRGVYAFDSMISAAQFRFLRDDGPRPMRWSVWTAPEEDAPGVPPFDAWDYPAFGLVHPGIADSAAQMDQAPVRLLRTISTAHAAGDLAAGRLACDRLRCLHEIEDAMTDYARRNQLFYAEPQDALADGIRRVRIDHGMPPGAVLDPPTLAAEVDGESAGAVLVMQGALGDSFHTRWLRLGPDGLPLGPALPVQAPFAALRLAPFRDRLIAAGVVPGPDLAGPPRLALAAASASLGAEGGSGRGELGFGQPIALGEPDPSLWRGPWPLAVDGEDIRLLRTIGPAASLRLDAERGELVPVAAHAGPRLAEDLFGSAPLVRHGDGWLAVLREDSAFPGGPPLDQPVSGWTVYQQDIVALHRLAAFDDDLRMTRISHPFVFGGIGHEACGGMAIVGDRLVLAWDRARDETWLSIMPLAEAERLMMPVENLMLAGRWPAAG